MSSTYSSRLRLQEQGTGDNTNTWGSVLNSAVIQLVDDAVAGAQSLDLTATPVVTLTTNNGLTDQARMAMLLLTGTLTANTTIIVPNLTQRRWVYNNTTGAFTVKFKPTTGPGSTFKVPQGTVCDIVCDASNVIGASLPVSASPSNSLGTAAFVNVGTASANAPTVENGNTLWGRLGVANSWTGSNTFTSATTFSGQSNFSGTAIVSSQGFCPPYSLTDGPTISVPMVSAINFVVTLGGNRTLSAPTSPQAGQSGIIVIFQDGTGSRTLGYDVSWKFPNKIAPILTSVAGAIDVLSYYVVNTSVILASMLNNLG